MNMMFRKHQYFCTPSHSIKTSAPVSITNYSNAHFKNKLWLCKFIIINFALDSQYLEKKSCLHSLFEIG